MKAFIVDKYGSKTSLRLGDMPVPELREDEVLVEVHAAGVNLLDSQDPERRVQALPAVSRAVRPERGRAKGKVDIKVK